jgi:hypothetical protein
MSGTKSNAAVSRFFFFHPILRSSTRLSVSGITPERNRHIIGISIHLVISAMRCLKPLRTFKETQRKLLAFYAPFFKLDSRFIYARPYTHAVRYATHAVRYATHVEHIKTKEFLGKASPMLRVEVNGEDGLQGIRQSVSAIQMQGSCIVCAKNWIVCRLCRS